MNIEQVREYTLSLYGVTEDQAFGEDILNFRKDGRLYNIPRNQQMAQAKRAGIDYKQ